MPRRPPPVSRAKRHLVPKPPPQVIGTVSDPNYSRKVPLDYRASQPIDFYPSKPERIEADILEIGPGRGDFLMTTAQQHPELRFVAVELGKKRHAKLIERSQKRNLQNVLLILSDARVALPKFFDAATVSSVVVLFPDPWPKRRHAFNRLLQPDFLIEIARVLRPGGHLYVKSDVEAYLMWVRQQVAQLPQYRIVEDRWPWGPVDGQDGKTLSLFADRQTGFGYGIHSLCLERVAKGS